MRKDFSKYNNLSKDFKNLKITYFLGAGASFNSIPIWKGQGESMKNVGDYILGFIDDKDLLSSNFTQALHRNEYLTNFSNKIKEYGELAIEFGSIDIYAKRLQLLADYGRLKELKNCLSIYFDLWENFVHKGRVLSEGKLYSRVDKRYLSLLSVLLQEGIDKSYPKLHENVSFISWNYDLQLEMAYESFMGINANSLEEINDGLNFMGGVSKRREIIHLNGFRGNFIDGGKYYDNVQNLIHGDIKNYLSGLLRDKDDFKKKSYSTCIKYAWEQNSGYLEEAVQVMRNTDILIIIGYSFPSFNRKIDAQLINAFQEEDNYLDIIYQDPNANPDLINSLFDNPNNVNIKENTGQFYIPSEFLFPPNIEDFSVEYN